MGKKKEEKWLQMGNFLLGVEKNAHGSYVVCKTVSGHWMMRWREDNMMFLMMLNVMKQAAEDDNVKDYLHSLVTVFYTCTSYVHDIVSIAERRECPFFEGFARLLKEEEEFEASVYAKSHTKDEEDAALKEVGEMTDIQEELEKLDKDDKD